VRPHDPVSEWCTPTPAMRSAQFRRYGVVHVRPDDANAIRPPSLRHHATDGSSPENWRCAEGAHIRRVRRANNGARGAALTQRRPSANRRVHGLGHVGCASPVRHIDHARPQSGPSPDHGAEQPQPCVGVWSRPRHANAAGPFPHAGGVMCVDPPGSTLQAPNNISV